MKLTILLLSAFLVLASEAFAQRVWSSSKGTVTFTKAGFADWTQPANQDRITDSVWITRASSQSIFNIRKETGYVTGSPVGTVWAFGTTDSFKILAYKPFITLANNSPQSLIGKNLVLKLVAENTYLDVKFTAYGSGSTGSEFTYTRAASITGIASEASALPAAFRLGQNYPNPFNPSTTIDFTLGKDGLTTLKVYNLLGREVATLVQEELKAGVLHHVVLDASDLSSGVYVYRLTSGGQSTVRKLTLLR